MDFDDFEREKNRLVPALQSWLIELRAMATPDPRAYLNSVFDGSGPPSIACRVRLGNIDAGAISPAEFNAMVDSAASRL
jgi:hypothetical protein